ncbi:hypothetical protein F5144DRAFT_287106 [Chaetomium tenue]|uniref:Uncharacterized protein n=1 Tax=Chaetomium tenue TaxID=1854479 RepID=A0ACB7P5K8_9PEZI|nr:hypothetical protein F5144DRAFT_287106 [Chaetomium globosum]
MFYHSLRFFLSSYLSLVSVSLFFWRWEELSWRLDGTEYGSNASGSDGVTAVGRLDGALCVVFSGTGHGRVLLGSRLHRSGAVDLVPSFSFYPPSYLHHFSWIWGGCRQDLCHPHRGRRILGGGGNRVRSRFAIDGWGEISAGGATHHGHLERQGGVASFSVLSAALASHISWVYAILSSPHYSGLGRAWTHMTNALRILVFFHRIPPLPLDAGAFWVPEVSGVRPMTEWPARVGLGFSLGGVYGI